MSIKVVKVDKINCVICGQKIIGKVDYEEEKPVCQDYFNIKYSC